MYQNAVCVTGVNHAMYAVNPGTGLGSVDSGYVLNVNYRAMRLKTVNGSDQSDRQTYQNKDKLKPQSDQVYCYTFKRRVN